MQAFARRTDSIASAEKVSPGGIAELIGASLPALFCDAAFEPGQRRQVQSAPFATRCLDSKRTVRLSMRSC